MNKNKVFEGILITKVYKREGKETEPEMIKVVDNECEAEDVILQDAGYYNDLISRYDRLAENRMIIFISKKGNEKVTYTYGKCLVIGGE